MPVINVIGAARGNAILAKVRAKREQEKKRDQMNKAERDQLERLWGRLMKECNDARHQRDRRVRGGEFDSYAWHKGYYAGTADTARRAAKHVAGLIQGEAESPRMAGVADLIEEGDESATVALSDESLDETTKQIEGLVSRITGLRQKVRTGKRAQAELDRLFHAAGLK